MMGSKSRHDNMIAADAESQQARNSSSTYSPLQHHQRSCIPSFAWREKVSQWCYDVADHLEEDRSIVYVAMYILDRYCESSTSPINEKKYEIASLSAIFLAVHIAGSGELTLRELISMSRGGITVKHIVEETSNISDVVSLKDRILTPSDFVRSLIRDVPSLQKQVLLDSASYMIELAVCDSFFSRAKASTIAIAAILNALDTVSCPSINAAAHSLIKGSSFAVDSFDTIKMLRSRLHCIYNHSVENLQQAGCGPHIIEDDDDDSNVVCTSTYNSTNTKRNHLFIVSDDEPISRKRANVEY